MRRGKSCFTLDASYATSLHTSPDVVSQSDDAAPTDVHSNATRGVSAVNETLADPSETSVCGLQ